MRGFSASTADPSTSLRDDKGRVVTYLQLCESDREFFFAIRLAEFKVSNHSPLVIPTGAKRSGGICSAPRPDATMAGKQWKDLQFLSGYAQTFFSPEVRLSCPEGLRSSLAREYVRPLALVFDLWRVRAALDDFFNSESRTLQVTFRHRRWYEEEVQ
jgi:hypothetical protein